MERLLEAIVRTRCRVAILDVTGVENIDAPTMTHLLDVVVAAQLLGSRCVLSGISPRVAQTIAGLELDLRRLCAFGTLEEALRFALQHAGQQAT